MSRSRFERSIVRIPRRQHDRAPIAIFLPALGSNGLSGGAERVALTLSEQFVRAGRPTDLVLSTTHPSSLAEVPDGVRVVDLRCRRLWTSLPRLVAYRWRSRPSVVLSLMPLANVLNGFSARLSPRAARRAVLCEHNIRSIALERDFAEEGTRWLHPLCRITYPRAAAIIGCSQGVADRVVSAYPSMRDRTIGIPNPVEGMPSDLSEASVHEWLDDETVPCIVWVGRLHAQKDPLAFLRALARVRENLEVRALMVGDGPMRSEVEEELERVGLGQAVCLLGQRPDARALLARADLLVHTARWEGFGLVIVEALAAGVPIVATDCEWGPREVLADGLYGHLVPIGDIEALARAIVIALENEADRALLRARAEDFAPSVIAGRYLDVLDSVSS